MGTKYCTRNLQYLRLAREWPRFHACSSPNEIAFVKYAIQPYRYPDKCFVIAVVVFFLSCVRGAVWIQKVVPSSTTKLVRLTGKERAAIPTKCLPWFFTASANFVSSSGFQVRRGLPFFSLAGSKCWVHRSQHDWLFFRPGTSVATATQWLPWVFTASVSFVSSSSVSIFLTNRWRHWLHARPGTNVAAATHFLPGFFTASVSFHFPMVIWCTGSLYVGSGTYHPTGRLWLWPATIVYWVYRWVSLSMIG